MNQPTETLASHYYVSEEIFERERQEIFFKSWLYAGHASQLKKTGDYFTFEVLDQKLFCVRDDEGNIRAFYNVCQHRAHLLVEGAGHKKSLVCPYHAWSYHFDGRLKRIPHRENLVGIDESKICLSEVRVDNFLGFIFVNLDLHAASMDEWFPNARKELHARLPHIKKLCPVVTREVTEQCNWKVSVENYSECYHCRLNHPTFASGVIDANSFDMRAVGHCLRGVGRSVDREKMSYAVGSNEDAHLWDYDAWLLWPTFSFQVYPGNVLNTYSWFVESKDTVVVYRHWYTENGVADQTISELAEQDLKTTVAEDVRLVEAVQQGLMSRGYSQGMLAIDPNYGVNSEHSIAAIKQWVLEAIG